MFYLLTTGISQLNKAGHPQVHKWTDPSPDRVYAYAVDGHPELGAYIRIKAGKSKAFRGQYTRSAPFFTMRFDSVHSALGTLLQTDDMLAATAAGRMSMEGSPEYGAELGALMMMVGEVKLCDLRCATGQNWGWYMPVSNAFPRRFLMC